MNIKKIIKEVVDEFEWANGDIDLRGYILNFEPAIVSHDFDMLVKRLNELGITHFGDGATLESGFITGGNTFLYQSNGVHFIYVKNNNKIMSSSGPLFTKARENQEEPLASYMEDSEGWRPHNLLDGNETLNM